MKQQINLTTDEAIILQQLHEDGEDDTRSLAQMTGMSRRYVVNLLPSLRRKELISVDNIYGELWARATKKVNIWCKQFGQKQKGWLINDTTICVIYNKRKACGLKGIK